MTSGKRNSFRFICLPGLLEPHFAFARLKHALADQADSIEIFPDRIVGRDLTDSVDRLAEMIRVDQTGEVMRSPIVLITHSFGDWVARQAIARQPRHRVTALISIAPAMQPGWVLHAFDVMTAWMIPEMRVIMDPARSTASLEADAVVARLILWAKADIIVRPIACEAMRAFEIKNLPGTHLSIVMQTNTIDAIKAFLNRAVAGCN